MQLILRGKSLGFSLRDIKDFLDLYDHDPAHLEQMHLLQMRVSDRIAELEQQQSAIVQTLAELRTIERQALDHIRQIEG
jgi:DNA-binding transcriptional MerR regulator